MKRLLALAMIAGLVLACASNPTAPDTTDGETPAAGKAYTDSREAIIQDTLD